MNQNEMKILTNIKNHEAIKIDAKIIEVHHSKTRQTELKTRTNALKAFWG